MMNMQPDTDIAQEVPPALRHAFRRAVDAEVDKRIQCLSLEDYPEGALLSDKQLGRIVGRTQATIRRWRQGAVTGVPLPFRYLPGGSAVVRVGDFREWWDRHYPDLRDIPHLPINQTSQ